MKTYTTVQGDMWDAIAYTQLGNEGYTDKLINLNQRYREFFTIPAGIVLNLPDAVEPIGDTLPPWKQVMG